MIKIVYLKPSLFFCLLLIFCFLTPSVYANVSLSVNSIDGGSGIRFDRVSPGLKNTRQLQIRVSSNGGKQYQVFQRVFEPITNEKGQSLNLSAIETVTLPSSNTSGTLYLQNVDHLSYSEQLIYTSGQGGESDSFGVAYNASPELISGSGNFRGKVLFTVRSLGAGDQNETIVDFTLDNKGGQIQVSVVGDHESKRVHIKDTDVSEERADFVKVSFSNNGAEEIKIYQEFVSVPVNERGTDIPLDAIRVSVQGNGGPNIRSGDGSLGRSRVLLYSGSANEDEFAVYFLVNSERIQQIDAGLYKGQVRYIVESGSNHQEFSIDVEYEVQPLFTIDVILPSEGISFGHVLASSPAQEKQVLVTVRSNLHKPYQVLQNMTSVMTNEKGKEFDRKYFNFKVDLSTNQKGHTKYADFSTTEKGEYPIYYSDAQGSPVELTVIYQLKGYFDMNPGNFVAPLKFSLNQN